MVSPAGIEIRQNGNALSSSSTPSEAFRMLVAVLEDKLGTREALHSRYRDRLEFYCREVPVARLVQAVKGSRATRSVAYFLTPAPGTGICLFEDLRLRVLAERAERRKRTEARGAPRTRTGETVSLGQILGDLGVPQSGSGR